MQAVFAVVLALAGALLGGVQVSAQSVAQQDARFIEPIPNHLLPGFVRFARVAVDDRVTGNCWTDANTAAALLTRRLAEGGVMLLDYEPADRTLAAPLFVLSGMGYRFNQTQCVVSAQLRVQSFAGRPTAGFNGERFFMIRQPARVFEMAGVYIHGDTANRALADFVVEAADAFLGARRDAMADARVIEAVRNDPTLITVPMSRDDALRMVGKPPGG